MKFDCGPSQEEKRAAKEKWHKYFAWFPVKVGDRDCRWLEYVERIGVCNISEYDLDDTEDCFEYYESWEYQYRAIPR